MSGPFDLSGKVAAVTGASSGIGREICLALAEAGASVVGVARRQAPLDAMADEVEKHGGRAAAIVADLSDHHKTDAVAAALSTPFGSPDILVNAAGVNHRETWDAVTPQTWDAALSLNLAIPFFLGRSLVAPMIERGWGKIINIASLQSERAFPNSIPYGASKGGVAQLTRAMAEAWSAKGVGCNAIAPGFFPTELTAPVFANPDLAQANSARTAIGRNGELQDLRGLAVFLAASASDYITGQVIFIDGGFTAK